MEWRFGPGIKRRFRWSPLAVRPYSARFPVAFSAPSRRARGDRRGFHPIQNRRPSAIFGRFTTGLPEAAFWGKFSKR